MSEIKDDTGRVIVAGNQIRWKDRTGERGGNVMADDGYEGGLRVAGRSLKEIWDNSEEMEVLS